MGNAFVLTADKGPDDMCETDPRESRECQLGGLDFLM